LDHSVKSPIPLLHKAHKEESKIEIVRSRCE